MVVPMMVRGRALGCLTLCYSESGRRYTAGDLRTAEQLALQIALAIDNTRLLHAAKEHEEIGMKARPALTRLRRAIERLRAGANSEERARLIGHMARHERTLSRLLERGVGTSASFARGSRARL